MKNNKQASFLVKYKDMPKEPAKTLEDTVHPMIKYLINLPEGEFSMAEGDTEKDKEWFLAFLQAKKRLFFEEYHFVIKIQGNDFNKILI